MNHFYVDPYVDGDQSSDSRAAAPAASSRRTGPTSRPIQAPAYSPSASQASTSATPSAGSPSPSPRASRTRATTQTAEQRASHSHSGSGAVTSSFSPSGSPRAGTPYMSPPRRPPSMASPRGDLAGSPRAGLAATPGSPRTVHGGFAQEAHDAATESGDDAVTTSAGQSPVRRPVPVVPRTRGPGSRTVAPGATRFDHRRRSSITLSHVLNAAAASAVDADDGSILSRNNNTVPSLFATMHSRRRVRTDGVGSSATMLSKSGTRLRTGTGVSPQSAGGDGDDVDVDDEDVEEVETLELPMQHYVAQSAYTMRNPFRTQDFAAFASNPSYVAPPDIAAYTEVPTCGDGIFAQQRASEGSFLIGRLADLTLPSSEADRARLYAYLGRTLEVLQTGEWFLKWTRDNRVRQRFVWLNLQRGTVMWSSTAKQSLFDNSELKLSTVTDVRPDCIQDETTGRVFYRMQVRTPDRSKTFATEIREKFDMWFQALVELTRPNQTNGLPGVWGRPSEVVNNNNGRGVPGRWTARYSLLSAIAEGEDHELGLGRPLNAQTSSGD